MPNNPTVEDLGIPEWEWLKELALCQPTSEWIGWYEKAIEAAKWALKRIDELDGQLKAIGIDTPFVIVDAIEWRELKQRAEAAEDKQEMWERRLETSEHQLENIHALLRTSDTENDSVKAQLAALAEALKEIRDFDGTEERSPAMRKIAASTLSNLPAEATALVEKAKLVDQMGGINELKERAVEMEESARSCRAFEAGMREAERERNALAAREKGLREAYKENVKIACAELLRLQAIFHAGKGTHHEHTALLVLGNKINEDYLAALSPAPEQEGRTIPMTDKELAEAVEQSRKEARDSLAQLHRIRKSNIDSWSLMTPNDANFRFLIKTLRALVEKEFEYKAATWKIEDDLHDQLDAAVWALINIKNDSLAGSRNYLEAKRIVDKHKEG